MGRTLLLDHRRPSWFYPMSRKHIAFKKGFYLFIFRMRGREGWGRETLMWRRNIDWLTLISPLTRDQTCNPGICPGQPFAIWNDVQPTKLHWSGQHIMLNLNFRPYLTCCRFYCAGGLLLTGDTFKQGVLSLCNFTSVCSSTVNIQCWNIPFLLKLYQYLFRKNNSQRVYGLDDASGKEKTLCCFFVCFSLQRSC